MKNRSSSTRRKLLLAAPLAAAGAALPAAKGDIIYAPFNGGANITINTSQVVFFDVGNGVANATSSSGANYDFGLYFASGNAAQPRIVKSSGDGIAYTGTFFAYAQKFSSGSPIDGSSFTTAAYLSKNGGGPWAADGTVGYLGVQVQGSDFGWIEVSYNTDSTLTLISAAYDNTGAPIAAGATSVPEPAESAALAAVLAGSLAAFRARQRRKAQKAA
jgi:hypothetical protein